MNVLLPLHGSSSLLATAGGRTTTDTAANINNDNKQQNQPTTILLFVSTTTLLRRLSIIRRRRRRREEEEEAVVDGQYFSFSTHYFLQIFVLAPPTPLTICALLNIFFCGCMLVQLSTLPTCPTHLRNIKILRFSFTLVLCTYGFQERERMDEKITREKRKRKKTKQNTAPRHILLRVVRGCSSSFFVTCLAMTLVICR